jgi:hypothetical protein
MKRYFILFALVLFVIFGCSGEAYIKVANATDAPILVSVNNAADEPLPAGDTTDTYTVTVNRGVINHIPVSATGEWLTNYTESVAISHGETVTHPVRAQLADISIVNTSVDSVYCELENSYYIYLAGGGSANDKYPSDGNITLEYEGPYFFYQSEQMSWFPGYAYTEELVPDACEIELQNNHPSRVVYYVYISPGDADTWGSDRLGDDTVLYPAEAYVWKAEGGVHWDMRIEAGDPHPDSVLYVYEYYDTEGCDADYTWIYDFPAIFSPLASGTASKGAPGNAEMLKSRAFGKGEIREYPQVRIKKISKREAGKAGRKYIRK